MFDQYYTLSELLYEARAQRGLSVKAVEKSTHIRSEYIQALEEARYDILPADVYIRGILKNYAEFLEIPYEIVMKLYRKDGVLSGNVTTREKTIVQAPQRARILFFGKAAFVSVIVIILLLIVAYMYRQYQIFQAPPDLVIDSPIDGYESFDERIMLSGYTDLDVELYINKQIVALDSEGRFETEFYLQDGENIITFESVSTRNEARTVQTRTVEYDAPEFLTDVLTLTAVNDSVDVVVTVNGAELFRGVLQAGEEKEFTDVETLQIDTSNALQTQVILSDQEPFLLGDLEEPSTLTLPNLSNEESSL